MENQDDSQGSNRVDEIEAIHLTENLPTSSDTSSVGYGSNQIQLTSQQKKDNNFGALNNVAFKQVFLILTLCWFVFLLILLNIPDKPGGWGVGVGMMLIGPVIISYVIYPVYFIILALRYSRERSDMHILDKVMFYVLLVPIASMGVFAGYKIYSENMIQQLFVAKAPQDKLDLIVKNVNFNASGFLDVEYCNNSGNSGFNVRDFSIKIGTDKNSEFVFEPVYVPLPGKCDTKTLTMIEKIGLKKGDVANIIVTIDPENKVSESNKDNNRIAKTIALGKVSGECFDTDGGRNYYEKGATTILSAGSIDCCRESLVAGPCLPQSQHLIEGYCESGKSLLELYECPKGCADGACVK